MGEVTISRRFCGPPDSGNGGYVYGLLARSIKGPATAVLRAPIPLDVPLEVMCEGGHARLTGAGELLIGEARSTDFDGSAGHRGERCRRGGSDGFISPLKKGTKSNT
jgi:hypothetical protein